MFCDPETTDAMRSVKVNTFFQPFKFEQLKAELINSGTAKFIERSRANLTDRRANLTMIYTRYN